MPFQLPGEHRVLQPFRRIKLIVHIAISVLPESRETFEGEVSCPRTHHLNNVPRLRGEKHDISLKILHQAGFETARQAAKSAERHALTIAPCPSLCKNKWIRKFYTKILRKESSSRFQPMLCIFIFIPDIRINF